MMVAFSIEGAASYSEMILGKGVHNTLWPARTMNGTRNDPPALPTISHFGGQTGYSYRRSYHQVDLEEFLA
jgi:hypothetical protein